MRADISNYCQSTSQPANTAATTIDQRIGMTTNFTCARGYAPGFSGPPKMNCTYYNATAGVWSPGTGSCVGTSFHSSIHLKYYCSESDTLDK